MADIDRIRWRCRRGLLELDLILKRFMEHHFDRLEPSQRVLFSELLEETDNDLLDWALGRAEPYNPLYAPLVKLLRAH
jgi:succinate dehydrogenase flavin-adding protein (antitoxin of CptAB toxin-antitoxin module)